MSIMNNHMYKYSRAYGIWIYNMDIHNLELYIAIYSSIVWICSIFVITVCVPQSFYMMGIT